MNTATVARPTHQDSAHWYSTTGEPVPTQIAKSTGQPRPTTLADARKQNLLPSVSGILKVLHKQALVEWLQEQSCLAVLTTPKLAGEQLDAFVYRVLHTEKVQDQEAQKARDLGTNIHAAMEAMFKGEFVVPDLVPWIQPAYEAVVKLCPVVTATEQVLVGNGYAGTCDFIGRDADNWEWLLDFKTTKNLPAKGSWWEHCCQLAAYLKCRPDGKRYANVYISTTERGKFILHDNGDFDRPYRAFMALVDYWQCANDFYPEQ